MPGEAPSFIEADAAPATEAALGMKPISKSSGAISVDDIPAAARGTAAAAPAKPAGEQPPRKSAKENIFAEMRRRFEDKNDSAAAAPGTEGAAPAGEAQGGEGEGAAPADGGEKPAGQSETDGKTGKRENPWKLVEQYKTKAKELETKLAELSKSPLPPEKVKPFEEQINELKKRNEQLEKDMRFVDYQKTDEFKNRYQKPYEESWKRAMTELSEVTIMDDSGAERAIEAKDVLQLVNMPLREAKQLAQERFGDFADEVMQHRKEIRRLFDEQTTAIQKAREEGSEWQKQQEEVRTKAFKETSESVIKHWNEANEAAAADPKYGKFFKPVEGDQEGNQRLAKGFELADRAFSENPLNAKTPEERAAIVRRHAAVRNRCAAFGRLVFQNQKYETRISELESKLKEYESAQPSRVPGTRANPQGNGGRTSAKESIFAELRKRAK